MAPDTEPALAGCTVAFSGRGLPPCSQMIGGCPSLERALALRCLLGLADPNSGRKGMKTQPSGRLPQIGAVSTHARMQTARDCTLAPHTHQVS